MLGLRASSRTIRRPITDNVCAVEGARDYIALEVFIGHDVGSSDGITIIKPPLPVTEDHPSEEELMRPILNRGQVGCDFPFELDPHRLSYRAGHG